MSDTNPQQTPPNDPWNGVSEALQHMTKLGWVGAANLVTKPQKEGFADVAFTPAGIEALKPFADFWRKTGGMNERSLLGVFWLAIHSQE